MSPFDNSAKRIFQPTSKIWSVTSSQVVYFQHPLPPKKLRRGKPARRLAARSHRLFNPASAGGQPDLVWSVTSSQVGPFQHLLPRKTLLRGRTLRRLAARSHRLLN